MIRLLMAEVVGFREEIVILMPYTNIRDISSGCLVESLGKPLEVKVGMNLIGKVLDSMGNPIDNSSSAERVDDSPDRTGSTECADATANR